MTDPIRQVWLWLLGVLAAAWNRAAAAAGHMSTVQLPHAIDVTGGWGARIEADLRWAAVLVVALVVLWLLWIGRRWARRIRAAVQLVGRRAGAR